MARPYKLHDRKKERKKEKWREKRKERQKERKKVNSKYCICAENAHFRLQNVFIILAEGQLHTGSAHARSVRQGRVHTN